jgi:hypothetical protein
MSDNPAEEKKSIFDAMPENPTLTESPWKPGSPCTFALFGKNQLITSIARLSEHGTLTIFPANPEVPAKDGWLIVKGGEFAERVKDGPSIVLVFPTAKEALNLAHTLGRLAQKMLLAECAQTAVKEASEEPGCAPSGDPWNGSRGTRR